ncbi:MAG: class I SAM-dependent methyltransferase [Acidimicrobiales bacterium]
MNTARRRLWDRLASDDPDWAVLTDPKRRGGGWTSELDEFYDNGDDDVASDLADLDPQPNYQGVAVDWGSGTGRLTLALGRRFASAVGVDISPHMVELARTRALDRGSTNVSFVTVDQCGVRDASLVYSKLVLQHLSNRREILRTLDEMTRLLAPNGYLIMQIPSGSATWRARVRLASRLWQVQQVLPPLERPLRKLGLSGITMTWISQARATRRLERRGLRLVALRTYIAGGYHHTIYVAQRR